MERLTTFNGGVWGMSMKAVADGYDRYSVFSKLAEYEDTGLTPEEIIRLNDFSQSQLAKLLEENCRLKQESGFWEREAKKYCARLGEIRILAESNERRI